MTQDSESVVVPRDQQRQLDAEQLMDAAGTLSRCGYGEDAKEVRAIALRLAAAPSTSVREEGAVTSDSEDYRHTFYGILNAQGSFWTPLAFDGPEAAKKHIENFWRGDAVKREQCLRTHRIVPVRVRLAALVPSTDEGKRHG